MSEFKVGDVVMRTRGCWKGMVEGDISTVTRVTSQGLELEGYIGIHTSANFRLHYEQPSHQQGTRRSSILREEIPMNKTIIIPQKAITKIIFLYDNGKKHHAAKIKKFNASTKDIDGTECIEYSNHTGAHRVYRDDLASITFICEDGYTTTQKLMDKVVVEADNARMYKKARQYGKQ